MARNRMITPEYFLDEELAKLSAHARLLYIGLWQIADDINATFPNRPLWIKAQLFPYEDIVIEDLLLELEKYGKIIKFAVDEKEYYLLKNFGKYQKIDHPSKERKYPSFDESSVSTRSQYKLSKVNIKKSEEKIRVKREEKQFIPPASPSGSFPKGFEMLKAKAKSLSLVAALFFLLAFPTHAHDVVLRYTIQSPYASHKFVSTKKTTSGTLPKPNKGNKSADVVINNRLVKSEHSITPKDTKIGGKTDDSRLVSGGQASEIAQMIKKIFGSHADVALAIAKAESGLSCGAIGDGHLDPHSYGVFQIRAFVGRPSIDQLMDCETNIKWAHKMFLEQGWGPWSTYTSGSYLKFL